MNYTEPAHPTLPQRALDSSPGTAYLIVVNAEGQHSIWPSTLAVPAGWRPSGQPDATAVVSTAGELTYRQLSESANQLAHHLQGRGVGPETLVGVGLERGAETIRCLLAGLAFVLTNSGHARAFSGGGAPLLLVDELAPEIAAHPVTAPIAGLQPANLAYAIWTSGSTGAPKAVAVSHDSLGRLGQEVIREYGLTPEDRVLQLASLAFDTSLEQVLATLLSGATLMLPGASPVAPSDLVRYLAQQRMSVADLTPAYWHQILADGEDGAGQLGSLRLA